MAIKVKIPDGQDTATISGLYQWDYGQELEIESIDLGTMIGEVHFACPSMSEATVVICNFAEGVGSVTIPNECLEQSSPITAWIYEIVGTQGRTRKVITISVIARTRPSAGHDIPTEIADQYTQLITEVNEAIDKLENGVVVAKKSQNAEEATRAISAQSAGTASVAMADTLGRPLSNSLVSQKDGYTQYKHKDGGIEGGVVLFRIVNPHWDVEDVRIITEISGEKGCSYAFTRKESNGVHKLSRFAFTLNDNGLYSLKLQEYDQDMKIGEWEDLEYSDSVGGLYFYYKHLVKYNAV